MHDKDLKCGCEPFNSCDLCKGRPDIKEFCEGTAPSYMGAFQKNKGIANKIYKVGDEWMTAEDAAKIMKLPKSQFLQRLREGATIKTLQRRLDETICGV